MSLDRARAHLKRFQKDQAILEFEVSSATVALAAQALGTEPARIAKTLSFMGTEGPLLVVCAGDVKVDNPKFKQEFGLKASMLSPDQARDLVGHEVGGVCPFGVNEGVAVYLDVSLRRFETVYPACGSSNSCIQLTPEELDTIAAPSKWVDVCRDAAAVSS